MTRKALLAWGAAAVAAALAAAAFVARSPDFVFLVSEDGAAWIRLAEPLYLGAHEPAPRIVRFRRRIVLDRETKGPLLARALKTAAVFVDGKPLLRSTDPGRWKTAARFGLAFPAGPHEVEVVVTRSDGPPALLLSAPAFGLRTGDGAWVASADGASWTPAARVDAYAPPAASLDFGAPAGRAALPLALVFAAVFAWLLRKPKLDPEKARWVLLAAWTALALNDMAKLPLACGFDIRAHMDYVRFIADFRALPGPAQGWETFQAPLYYLVAAALYSALIKLATAVRTWRLLRLIGLACGAAQIEFSYRAARRLCPGKPELVVAGTLLGGLLPVSVYMSQFVGNEALAGALSAAAILAAWRLEDLPPAKASWREPLSIGILLGLAILAKVSALLLVVPLGAYALAAWPSSPKRPARQAAAAALLAAAAVSGWFFARNQAVWGAPLVSGWDPRRGFDFWQDPSWRTPRDLLSFSWALRAPIYSAPAGFWDSLYSTFWLDGFWGGTLVEQFSPAWNLSFVAMGAWLALLPTAAIALGGVEAAKAPPGPRGRALRFSAACVLLYGAALLGVFLRHPYFSSAKASYALGIVPCFVALGCAGLERLHSAASSSRARAALLSAFACWAACSYAAYFRL